MSGVLEKSQLIEYSAAIANIVRIAFLHYLNGYDVTCMYQTASCPVFLFHMLQAH